MQNEKNNSLPTQGGGAGDRETDWKRRYEVASIFRDARGGVRITDRDRELADLAIAALQAAPSEGGEPVAWHKLAVTKPLPGHKVVGLYNDGSGACLYFVHENGVIDHEGDEHSSLSACDQWAYLPSGFEFWCEGLPEDAYTLPAHVIPNARPPAPSEEPLVGWRPIETHDGSDAPVLLFADNTTHPSLPSTYVEKGYRDGKWWRIVNNGDYNSGGYGIDYYTEAKPGEYGYPHPTHWMPLPAAPAPDAIRGGE